jgi:hypothetical protein
MGHADAAQHAPDLIDTQDHRQRLLFRWANELQDRPGPLPGLVREERAGAPGEGQVFRVARFSER